MHAFSEKSPFYEWLLNVLPKSVLDSQSSHDTKCDSGVKAQSEKTSSSNDIKVGFRQTQEEKPNNTKDSTALYPCAVILPIFNNSRYTN